MRRILHLVVLLALVGGAVLLWRQVFPSPEKQIRKRLEELRELVSFRASEGNLAVLADLQHLGSLFTRDAAVRVDMEAGPRVMLTGRDSIQQAVGAARQAAGNLDVEFRDVVVTVGEDKQSAVVEVTGMARQKGSNELWIEELRFHFIHTDEGWQISSVETVQTMTRKVSSEPALFPSPDSA